MEPQHAPRLCSENFAMDRQEDVALGALASPSPCSHTRKCVLWEQRALGLDSLVLWTQPSLVLDWDGREPVLPGSALQVLGVGVHLSLEEGRALSRVRAQLHLASPAQPSSLPPALCFLLLCPGFLWWAPLPHPISPHPFSNLLFPGLTWECCSQGQPPAPECHKPLQPLLQHDPSLGPWALLSLASCLPLPPLLPFSLLLLPSSCLPSSTSHLPDSEHPPPHLSSPASHSAVSCCPPPLTFALFWIPPPPAQRHLYTCRRQKLLDSTWEEAQDLD